MFISVLCLLTITVWVQVECHVPVPSIYRNVEEALERYSSNSEHNPVIYSLLNALVYDKRSRAFITDQATETALEEIKKFNKKDEQTFRQIIYSTKKPLKSNKIVPNLEDQLISALDIFFSNSNTDDYRTFDLLSQKKKFNN